MFVLSKNIINLPIVSLQTGQAITHAKSFIIDPATLNIIAMHCDEVESIPKPVLLYRDIRELAVNCIIVDNESAMSDPIDIVRLKPFLDNPYILMNTRVGTEGGRRLGKVEDFTVNSDNFQVQKIYVHPTFIKALYGPSLIIDRSQIVDINHKFITVKDTTTTIPARDIATVQSKT